MIDMKLQNNFTTPEQSKKLLELGVPADSADCYYDHYKNLEVRTYSKLENTFFDTYTRFTPCWSVGRLIEMIRECVTDYDIHQILIETLVVPATDNLDVLVELMTASECKSDWDFSKLKKLKK